MSERGTFVTSYLYDARLAPLLEDLLPRVCVKNTLIGCRPYGSEWTRFFAGMLRASYNGEEYLYMKEFIESDLIAALPEDHGIFEIMVLPESAEYAGTFQIHKRRLVVLPPRDPE